VVVPLGRAGPRQRDQPLGEDGCIFERVEAWQIRLDGDLRAKVHPTYTESWSQVLTSAT